MSDYVIKNYHEDFLEAQEAVGKEATKDWNAFGQTPADQLKRIYSQENFDPETKFYAFRDDKLVGFLTSTIIEEEGVKRANLEFPLTLPEHNSSAEPLFKQAIETLKKKGVTKVQARVGEPYKGTIKKAEKWGFKYSKDLYILLSAKINDLQMEESEIEVKEFDSTNDLNQMITLFVEKFGVTEEYARNNFERITKDKENFPIHLIIKDNEQIVGRLLAYRNPNNPKEFNFGSLYMEEETYFEPLISTAITQMKSHDVETVSLFLFGQTLAMEDKYSSIGFSREGKIDYFEKEI